MSLGQLVKSIKKAETLIVTPRIEAWLREHPDGIVWDDAGIELWRQLVQRTVIDNNDRSGRFGASSRGVCLRRQVFTYLGMPAVRLLDPATANLFNDGKLRHLKWQMMGLQSGTFTHAEYPHARPKWRVKVSMDGLNVDDAWLFELKGDSNWSRALDGIPEPHMLQMHTMMFVTGWDMFVYVIEDKRSLDWREIIVRRDPALIAQVKQELEELNEYVEHRRLPDILPACSQKTGPYRTCPFAGACLSQPHWPDKAGTWDYFVTPENGGYSGDLDTLWD